MMRSTLAFSYLLPIGLAVIAVTGPYIFEMFDLIQISTFATMALAVLGLAYVWGNLGILSFGHSAFFGLGAYTYAIVSLNFGESTLAIALAIILPTAFSLLLGYFLFFGRVGDVYLGVITLCVTLVLFNFTTSTADPYYRIGNALLGGFNGITAIPPLNWPGQPNEILSVEAMFRLCLIVLAVVYILLNWLRQSRLGRIVIAIRESEARSELLGYDVRLYKMLAFSISAAIAGLAGGLYTSIGGYVGPTAFDLNQASQFLLWVIAGGLGTHAGPVLASFAFQYLSMKLGTSQLFNTDLIFGAIIIIFVVMVPKGLLPSFSRLWNLLTRHRDRQVQMKQVSAVEELT